MKLGKLQKTWIKSLREHPERQCKGRLGRGSSRKYEACCLGELHLCYHRLKKKKLPFFSRNIKDGESFTGILAESYHKYGLISARGGFIESVVIENHTFMDLAEMNDNGLTWPEIADYIENNPENVFTKSV